MRVMSIFGTRPEMIKMWATLKKLDELNFDHVMVHTGQNFTPELKDFFFKDLDTDLVALADNNGLTIALEARHDIFHSLHLAGEKVLERTRRVLALSLIHI